jgi:hypothetical protein
VAAKLTKFWILRALEPVSRGDLDGLVVLADTIREAREVAAREAASRGADQEAAWRDPWRSSCQLVRYGRAAKVVLASRAGGRETH